MDNLEMVFGSRELSGLITTFADDSRDKYFQELFKAGQRLTPWDPNHIEWDDERFNRALAPMVGLSDGSPSGKLTKRLNKSMSAYRFAEHVFIPAERLFYQRASGALLPDASQVLEFQVKNLQRKIMRSVEKVSQLTLAGSVPSTAFAGSLIDDTVTWPVKTLSAVADWATPSTLIISSEIELLQKAYRNNVNMLPGTGILNITTESYILENSEVQALSKQPLQQANMILTADVFSDSVLNGLSIRGMKWRKHLGTYTPDGGSVTEFMPDATIYVLPREDNMDVLGMAECSTIVPASLWGDAATVGVERMAPGFAAYTESMSDPVGIKLVASWIGAPIIRFPEAVLVYTTHP